MLYEETAYEALTSANTVESLSDKQEQTAAVRETAQDSKPQQMELFDDRLLSAKAKEHYDILGQLFETYWLIAYQDKLLIVDQHAAHEKVKYERLMKHFRENTIASQALNPPLIVTLSGKEKECYVNHTKDFESLGFVIEEFGGNDYAIRGVPMDLYGYEESRFFYDILDELAEDAMTGTPESIRIRIATMACKAAVKGNMRLRTEEMRQLIDELLTLDNPYNCPHGRPTIISMSKYEIEKKFKRIV
jgi:DNA mismatch repair protein MutL